MRTLVDGPASLQTELLSSTPAVRAHFIGIGGSGMSGAAALFLKLGAIVSGSDQTPFEGSGHLVAAGARVCIGHRADQVPENTDLVVVSAAVPESNPELAEARLRGIRIIKYAELTGLLMRRFPMGIAVAGTHGKSTTSALCAYLLREGGKDPAFLMGAWSDQLGGGSGLGCGSCFVVEACEFDRSFLHLSPRAAAILNIEPDHLDCYRDLDDIAEAFGRFAAQVEPDGLMVCPVHHPLAQTAARMGTARIETFGLDDGADWQATRLRSRRGCYSFDVRLRGTKLVSTRLSIPGSHNVYNALAAMALAYYAGVDAASLAKSVQAFTGIRRRLMWRGKGRGITIVDDYAHHPTEIRVTIDAARRRYRPKRMWVIFQPHQHARTRYLMDQFAASFGRADEITVADVYGARETPKLRHEACVNGANGEPSPLQNADVEQSEANAAEVLVERIRQCGGRARYFSSLHDVAEHVVRHATAGDLVMTMGAGDVWKVADELVARICLSHGA